MKLSVVINTKNAATTLKRTLNSVKFADEVVIVDMHSTDATLQIARESTSKVYVFRDVGYVEPARNFAIGKATGDWILIVDADEEVLPSLAEKIQQLLENPDADAYYIARQNEIFNRVLQHSGWWPDYQLRLFRAGSVEWSDRIHAVPLTQGTVHELPAKKEWSILHHNYQDVSQFLQRLDRYSTIQAQDHSLTKLVTMAQVVRVFRQEWISRLFGFEAYRDGVHGVGLSFLQALYEVAVLMKQWQARDWQADNSGKQQQLLLDELATLDRELRFWWWEMKMRQWPFYFRWVGKLLRKLR